MTHVDVIRHDWQGRQEVFLGRVIAYGDDMAKLDFVDPEVAPIFDNAIVDPVTGSEVRPEQGRAYLEAIVRKYGDGTYLGCTEIHEEADCPFPLLGNVEIRAAAHGRSTPV